MKKILVVEDEIIIAEGLRLFLQKNDYKAVIASNADSAIERLGEEEFEGVICDINLQEKINGIEIIQNHHELDKHGPVIFLTAYSNQQVMKDAEEVSPYAYIIKPFNNQQLLTTLNLAIKNNQRAPVKNFQDESLLRDLSQREKEILQELATGKTNKDIADSLYISRYTVDTHVKNIKDKLNLSKKGELIHFVLSNKAG
ncbi:DNA-binding response regulator [Salinimicrobium sp. GXAS 041]|uniref:DNA-binding response regulator n=1 Tax=Salinimicrobium sp. GXAS 041 TaxID=3400806 RepID=UPI003C76AA72